MFLEMKQQVNGSEQAPLKGLKSNTIRKWWYHYFPLSNSGTRYYAMLDTRTVMVLEMEFQKYARTGISEYNQSGHEFNIIRSRCVWNCTISVARIQEHDITLWWDSRQMFEHSLKGSIRRHNLRRLYDFRRADKVHERRDKHGNEVFLTHGRPLLQKRRNELLTYGKNSLSLLIGVLTQHCAIERMSECMSAPYKDELLFAYARLSSTYMYTWEDLSS